MMLTINGGSGLPAKKSKVNDITLPYLSDKRTDSKSQRYEGLLQVFDAKGAITDKRWSFARLGAHGQSRAVLRFTAPAEVSEMGLAKLTGLDTLSVGALEQTIFYVNQVMQFGKLLAVFQRHPTDANQSIVTVFIALAVETSILAKKKEKQKTPPLGGQAPVPGTR